MKTLVESGVGILAALAAALAVLAEGPATPRAGSGTVVFVCAHGNVKSLIAGQWFNRLAAERGLTVRAVSRGLSPEASVPPPIADRLYADGFDVRRFRPKPLVPADLTRASRLVMIGAEPPAWVSPAAVSVDRWDGIPPASERYDAARDALRERIVKLLDSLAGASPVP